jgi:hypothetical protein
MGILYAQKVEPLSKKSFYKENVIRWQQLEIDRTTAYRATNPCYPLIVFVFEHLLHRVGEASVNLALTRNREPIEKSIDSRNAYRNCK